MTGGKDAKAATIRLRFAVPQRPPEAFEVLTRRLVEGLARRGLRLDLRALGDLSEGDRTFGRVTDVRPGREVVVETRPATWTEGPVVTVRIRCDDDPLGSMIAFEVEGWEEAVGSSSDDLADWGVGTLVPAVLHELAPSALGDWITDRKARRPSGEGSSTVYRDPTYHWPNFLHILDRIHLSSSDHLLEVGCGGGAFLRKALESGCTAVAVDHSPDMLRVAREQNRSALEEGRLELFEAEADRLPVPSSAFTCCVCTGAFGFFPNPRAALGEMHRALAPGGRLALFVGSSVLRGTPAAPEPIASRVKFYEAEELEELARDSGFAEVRVDRSSEAPYAEKAGLPTEVIAFFRQTDGGLLLLAQKPS